MVSKWHERAKLLRRASHATFDAEVADELRDLALEFDRLAKEDEQFGGPKENWRAGAPLSEEKPVTPGVDLPTPTPDKPKD